MAASDRVVRTSQRLVTAWGAVRHLSSPRRAVIAVVLAYCAGGCAARVARVNFGELSPAEQVAVTRVQVFNTSQLTDYRVTVVGIVEGVSCRHMLWDAPPSRTAAIEQAKYYAHKLGAGGITNVQFGGVEGTSYGTNYWESIRVTAEAITVLPK